MNRTVFALCAALALFVAAFTLGKAQTPTIPPSIQGRFLLYNLEFVASSNGSTFKDKGIFRIDTQTGETKQFATGLTKDGQLFSKWIAVDEK